MYNEDKDTAGTDKSREFGVLGDILRELQREELEETESFLVEIQETNIVQENSITQSTAEVLIEVLTEINATLKEIAETQNGILEEIRRNRTQ